MKNILTSIFKIIILVMIYQNSYAESNIYKLNNNNCLIYIYEKNQSDGKELVLKMGDCAKPAERYSIIDKVETPNDIPTVEWILKQSIDNKNYLIVMTSFHESLRDEKNYLDYTKFYLPMIYICNKDLCSSEDGKLNTFISSGGDIKNFKTNSFIEKYPYSSKNTLQRDLSSLWFNDWLNDSKLTGYTIRKTVLKADSNGLSATQQYLNNNAKFIVDNIEARKLHINVIGKNGQKIQGWIKCEDTNLCR